MQNDSNETRSFADVLCDLEGGTLEPELTDKLAEAVAAVREHRKAATITLELTIGISGKGLIAIASKAKVKKPEGDRLGTTFFLRDDGRLVRDDPRQERLPLRDVERNTAPVREAVAPTPLRAVETK